MSVSDQWAILELMGHVRLAGRITEEERFGCKLGRIDIPRGPKADCLACKGTGLVGDKAQSHRCQMPDCNGFTTQYFSGSSIYRLTPTTEEIARRVAVTGQPEPVHPWTLSLPSPSHEDDDDDPR